MAQTPAQILNQLEINLRSSAETESIRKRTRAIVEYLKRGGYSDLADDINRSWRHRNSTFFERDFEGALVYPDSEYSVKHEQKHSVAPLSFGILIPVNNWESFSRKLNLDPRHYGQNLDKFAFENSIFGLDQTGVTFHVNREIESDIEFEILTSDISLYSNTFNSAKQITREKLQNPVLIKLALEYMILSDLCALRVEPTFNSEKLSGYLQNRVGYYIDLFIDALNLPHQSFKDQGRKAFRDMMQDTIERIPSAVHSTYSLDDKIGTRLVTPLLFSLGSTKQEFQRNHLLSPWIGIISAYEHLTNGDIKQNEIESILRNKGYGINCQFSATQTNTATFK